MILCDGHPPKKLGEIIDGKTELIRFDGVTATQVYIGGLDYLTKAELQWREEPIMGRDDDGNEIQVDVWELLTLDEIAEQLKDNPFMLITIFIDDPMQGEILQYGNYNDGKWYRKGNTMGYA